MYKDIIQNLGDWTIHPDSEYSDYTRYYHGYPVITLWYHSSDYYSIQFRNDLWDLNKLILISLPNIDKAMPLKKKQ